MTVGSMKLFRFAILALVFFAWPSHAGPTQTCSVFLAAMQDGVPIPSLPFNAELSPDEAGKLKQLEWDVRDSLRLAGLGFWGVFSAVAERESYFSIRASALFASSFDEETGRWVDDEDGRQFWIHSSRALLDQVSLLSLAEFHLTHFRDDEAADVVDESLQSFLENARRRLVIMGSRDARSVVLSVQSQDDPRRSYPSVQWNLPTNPEKARASLPFLNEEAQLALMGEKAVLAVAPRFHAEFFDADDIWISRTEDGRKLIVIPWQNFINDVLGGVEVPAGVTQHQIQLKIGPAR